MSLLQLVSSDSYSYDDCDGSRRTRSYWSKEGESDHGDVCDRGCDADRDCPRGRAPASGALHDTAPSRFPAHDLSPVSDLPDALPGPPHPGDDHPGRVCGLPALLTAPVFFLRLLPFFGRQVDPARVA